MARLRVRGISRSGSVTMTARTRRRCQRRRPTIGSTNETSTRQAGRRREIECFPNHGWPGQVQVLRPQRRQYDDSVDSTAGHIDLAEVAQHRIATRLRGSDADATVQTPRTRTFRAAIAVRRRRSSAPAPRVGTGAPRSRRPKSSTEPSTKISAVIHNQVRPPPTGALISPITSAIMQRTTGRRSHTWECDHALRLHTSTTAATRQRTSPTKCTTLASAHLEHRVHDVVPVAAALARPPARS